MARKAETNTAPSKRRSRSSSSSTPISQVSHFPVAIGIDALKGPAPKPKRVVIPDYFGPNQPGQIWYLPITSNYLIAIGESETLHEIIHKVRDKLAVTVVNQDGTPLMTPEEWGEIDPDRLLEINQMISKAIGGEKSGKKGDTKKNTTEDDDDERGSVTDTNLSGNG